ncbi:MAG TPA: 1,4-alpha-glucan branching protein GlgB [Bryobacteraceae bacterium]|jgi:1,4-alpha-glucan branching enzyme|nr:1,4-alpha-glucan branching protein GlgB [Bryobacteraceae bacterium]
MSDRQHFFTDADFYYFQEGTHTSLARVMGAHLMEGGAHFAVWAPRAKSVSVIGDFNSWNTEANQLTATGRGGVWEGWVSGASQGAKYQFRIESAATSYRVSKADPYGFFQDTPPRTASILWSLDYQWGDGEWMLQRPKINSLDAPISIYEVHLGSWRRSTPDNRLLTYDELGDELIPYVQETGFTHVEFLPVMEHPFFGSWGYQVTGYFAPTSRYGTPQQFMRLIDRFHQHGIGVILDWVPSHFPNDEHGLGFFDGVHEYEPADPRRGVHPDWNSYIFDYERPEVRSFLLSSAMFWLETYHADGLRVDAVASMLYLDYSRREGNWIPNRYGGRENLEAIGFLRGLNEHVYKATPGVQTIAEESTAWPKVTRPTYNGGLGFGLKWDMGWMHDTLDYFSNDPVHRKFHHRDVTFRSVYAFNENFLLPLSHDEVVHGKASLINKMPGDLWKKFANLRVLFSYMYAEPGKKLLFMGNEIAQLSEWNHDGSIDWALLKQEPHAQIRLLVGDLNRLYRSESALYSIEYKPATFEWIDASDADRNIISFLRNGSAESEKLIIICNFSPVPRDSYRVGAPLKGFWKEILNTDAKQYGGSGWGNYGGVNTVPFPLHGRPYSLTVNVPPLATVYLKYSPDRS